MKYQIFATDQSDTRISDKKLQVELYIITSSNLKQISDWSYPLIMSLQYLFHPLISLLEMFLYGVSLFLSVEAVVRRYL